MKKYLLALITLSLLLCEACFTGGGMAFATPASLGNGVTWEISGTTLTIGYEGEGSGVMPDYSSVTGQEWNANKTSINSIVIEEGITAIGKFAFGGCSNAISVSIPSTVTTIGLKAFYGAGITSVTIPENVEAIGDETFNTCPSITSVVWNARNCSKCINSSGNQVDMGSGINPFYGTSTGPRFTVTSFTFGDEVEIIPPYVCYKMSGLSSVSIPASVTTIGAGAFGSTGLTSFTLPNTVTSFATSYAFQNWTTWTSITLPEYITEIGDYAFDGCTALTSITIPTSVTRIGKYAFQNCTALTSITIPSSVTTIDNYAFKGCSKITSLTIPNSVTSIGTNAFQNCTKLEFISLPSGITTISNYTFDGCSKLKAIDIPEGVTSIGTYAFQNCTTLERVHFPSTLTSIGNYAFRYTTALTSIPLASATSLKTIGTSAFELTEANATATGILVIPSTVTTINGNAFKNRSGITSVAILNTSTTARTTATSTSFTGMQTSIPVYTNSTTNRDYYKTATGWSYFASAGYTSSYTISNMNCGSPTASTLKASLNLSTGALTFTGSASDMANYTKASPAPWNAYKQAIKSITINSYVKTIGNYAFYDCPALTTVTTTNASALTTIGSNAFMYGKSLTSIAIPAKVTSIETNSFMYCAISDITWNAENYTKSSNASSNPFWYACSKEEIVRHDLITSFTFGSGVTYIPPYICYGMTGLTSISIPSSVTTIAGSAFSGCSSLESVILPTSLSEIKSGAFGNCNALTSVKYAGSVDQWCGITFGNANANPVYFAHGLKLNNSNDVSTTLSISASSIGKYAFAGYTDLTAVTFSSGVGSFGTSAFTGCTGLTSVRFNGTLAQWCDNTFANADANPLKNAHHFYLNSDDELTNLEIPEAITSITDYAFYNGSGFESISVYNTTSWEANTFTGCVTPTILGDVTGTCGEHLTWRLNGNTLYIEGYGDMYDYANNTSMPWYPYRAQIQNVEFVDEATSVGNYAFNGLTNIQSVDFGDGVTMIGQKAFYGCNGLTGTLTLGNSVETIGNEAFENCTGLTSVILNDGIEELDYKAFYGCSNLLSITVPTSLDTCGGYVFSSCGKIVAVYYQGSVDQWCSIKFNTSSSNPANNSIAKLYVDGNTETYLTSATITLPSIGAYSFYDNKELTSVIITTATSVGYDAFHGCNNLARMEVQTTTPPATASGNTMLFFGVDKTIPFYIPAAGASAYASADRWSDFADNRFLYGECGASGDNLTFVFEESTGTLTISGSGAMANYATASAMPWNSFKTSITSIVLEDGVTTIGNYAFYGCTALASVTFPETFSSIGNYAFYNCSALTSIALPEGITATGNSAFYGSTSLASVSLPSTLTTIGSNVFINNALTSIIIPNSVTSIGSGAFKGNGSLESVDLGEASLLTTIGNSAFENCSSLTSITIPNKVTSIGNSTFSGCSALAAVNYGDAPTLATIGYSTFKNCSSLTSITIPESVTTITGNSSQNVYTPFAGCTSLTTVIWNARNCSGWTPIHYMSSTYYQMPFEAIKTQITSFEFGSNVQSIPQYLCHGMSNLTTVTIHASVTSIGANAFEGCSKIELVTCDATTPPVAQSTTFSDITSNATLVVPGPSKATYASTDYWEDFYRILPYVVQFNLNGHGSAIIADEYVGYGARIEAAPTAPTETGYDFGGWYKEAGCSTPFIFGNELGTVVNSDMTLYAKWTAKEYTISYMDKGDATYSGSNIGSLPATHTYDAETALVDGVKIGYTFGGWFENSDCTGDAITSLGATDYTDAITLYAQWTINQYTISFDSNGGSEVSSITQDYNSAVTAPADPTREGYTFNGWSPAVPSTMPAENTECVAQWTENVFSFADTDTDNSKIVAANGKLALSVTIGRTIWRDGYYNSMCLPFSLTSEQLAASPLAGYKALKRLSDATITGEDENRELNIQLEPITEITAGEPFFISYEVGENITNPVFENVTVTASAPGIISKGDVTCRGLYTSTDLGTATTNLFLGANNTLYWPASGQSTIKGLRAYFAINPDSPAKAGMRVRLSDRPAEVPTALEETNHDPQIPIHKYIRDGVLFIERDGKTYNAQGVLVQ